MHQVIPRIALALGLFVASTPGAAQNARADSANALSTIERFHSALASGDSARATSLLSNDVLILESGAVQTRAEYLSHHLGADMKASQGSKGVRTIMRVSVLGDAAIVVAKTVTPPTGAEGSTGSELAELMVLSRTGSAWIVRAVHWSSRRRR